MRSPGRRGTALHTPGTGDARTAGPRTPSGPTGRGGRVSDQPPDRRGGTRLRGRRSVGQRGRLSGTGRTVSGTGRRMSGLVRASASARARARARWTCSLRPRRTAPGSDGRSPARDRWGTGTGGYGKRRGDCANPAWSPFHSGAAVTPSRQVRRGTSCPSAWICAGTRDVRARRFRAGRPRPAEGRTGPGRVRGCR